MKATNKPSWLDKIGLDQKTDIEPFSAPKYQANTETNKGYLVSASRPNGGKKVNFALRIEDEINTELDNCQGSKNAVINALLKYAIADLKSKGITLVE